MKAVLAAWLCGLLFGLGLSVSGLVDPAKVIHFVDVAGQWDPTLAFVMFGALLAFGVGFRLTQRSPKPLFAPTFQVPSRRDIDRPLVVGAVVFGVGWGLAGICPGPSITALAFGIADFYLFFAAMAVGSLAQHAALHTPALGRRRRDLLGPDLRCDDRM